MKKEHLYQAIADNIGNKIRNGVLKEGERLPSVRMLSQEHGISINTAKRIFLELESQSLINSKPQIGYFVNGLVYKNLPLPSVSQPAPFASHSEPNELINNVYSNVGRNDLTLFSIGVPSGSLLPIAKLNKEIITASRGLKESGTEYELVQGNLKLRRMIAYRSLTWGGQLHEEDIITTNGCLQALSLSLMAITKPNDTIALESPCYPGILQLAVSLKLNVLEVPTNPTTGIEIDALKKSISKINVCLLVPNYNTPLGYCMPEDSKKEIVKLLAAHNIPLIEDDTYGELHFDKERPKCCKSFDKEGNVIYCGAISKTLAPGFRVGWVAAGKYKDKILKLKLIHAVSSTSLIMEATANFLMNGRYDKHLIQLRKTLQENYQKYVLAISEYFPEGTKISQPLGGLSLWVEFPEKINTIELYNLALKSKISIAPGRMFSLQNQYENCMRLCFGLPWQEELKFKLKQLGNLANSLSNN